MGQPVTESTLIAISTDNGKNWYFVDTPGKDIQTMKKALPNLSGELVIPKETTDFLCRLKNERPTAPTQKWQFRG